MIHIEPLPDNAKLPDLAVRYFWWRTEHKSEFRIHQCFCDLKDGWNIIRLPVYTTKTFEVIAHFLAKFVPPTMEELCIKFRGVDEESPIVEVQLKLNGQPSTGTLAWLSFLRVGWEFQNGVVCTDHIICIPDYIVRVLKQAYLMNESHSPVQWKALGGLTIAQVVKLLYAIKSGVYDETPHKQGDLHTTSREVLS